MTRDFRLAPLLPGSTESIQRTSCYFCREVYEMGATQTDADLRSKGWLLLEIPMAVGNPCMTKTVWLCRAHVQKILETVVELAAIEADKRAQEIAS